MSDPFVFALIWAVAFGLWLYGLWLATREGEQDGDTTRHDT